MELKMFYVTEVLSKGKGLPISLYSGHKYLLLSQ